MRRRQYPAVAAAGQYRQFANEEQLQRAIEVQARALGYLAYHTRVSQGSRPGFPDLCICGHGLLLFVECKGPRGVVRPEQTAWLQEIERAGRWAILASTEDDSYDRIVEILQDYYQRDIGLYGRG